MITYSHCTNPSKCGESSKSKDFFSYANIIHSPIIDGWERSWMEDNILRLCWRFFLLIILVTVQHGISKLQKITDAGQKTTTSPFQTVVNMGNVFELVFFIPLIIPTKRVGKMKRRAEAFYSLLFRKYCPIKKSCYGFVGTQLVTIYVNSKHHQQTFIHESWGWVRKLLFSRAIWQIWDVISLLIY